MSDEDRRPTRRPEVTQPMPGAEGWLALGDDELLYRIEVLGHDHAEDAALMAVVQSDRHFFVRQEAAKRLRNPERLKAFAADRHLGQILVRQMTRASDLDYLEWLIRESRHLEVRKAAEAQLRLVRGAYPRERR